MYTNMYTGSNKVWSLARSSCLCSRCAFIMSLSQDPTRTALVDIAEAVRCSRDFCKVRYYKAMLMVALPRFHEANTTTTALLVYLANNQLGRSQHCDLSHCTAHSMDKVSSLSCDGSSILILPPCW